MCEYGAPPGFRGAYATIMNISHSAVCASTISRSGRLMKVFFFFQGMTCQEAQEQYIEILQKWPGYSSTLFDVKVNAYRKYRSVLLPPSNDATSTLCGSDKIHWICLLIRVYYWPLCNTTLASSCYFESYNDQMFSTFSSPVNKCKLPSGTMAWSQSRWNRHL